MFRNQIVGTGDAFLVQEIMNNYDIDETRKEAKEKITVAQRLQKAYYDAKRKPCREYELGKQVILRKNTFANEAKRNAYQPIMVFTL